MAIKSLAQTLKDLAAGIKNTITGITSSNATLTIIKGNGTTSTVTVNNVANAGAATKATQDSAGQQINSTYIKGLSVSGQTITYTKGNNTTGTITTQDTAYTHPNSGVMAGTYKSVTVNAQGHVTAGSNPTTIAGYGITDASLKSHTHDDRYYTESEINSKVNTINTSIDTKSDKTHTHDNRYLQLSGGALKGNIELDQGSTYSIGSENKKLKALYADEVHISQNTLYINETPVLGTDSDTIIVKADTDQSVLMKTSGIGVSQITSEKAIDVTVKGDNGNISVTTNGNNSSINLSATKNINIAGESISIDGNATIKNLNVTGTTTTVNSNDLSVKDNIIEINSGETGNGVSKGTAGIKVNRGDELPYLIEFDETEDMFKVGMQGDLETIASQNYVNGIVNNKSDKTHTHDDRYYTESEIDSKLAGKQGSLTATGSATKGIYIDSSGTAKAMTYSVNKDVPSDAKFTDTVYTHSNSGVTAGTYRNVTVNAQGHVTGGSNPTTIAGYGITDAPTKTGGGASGTWGINISGKANTAGTADTSKACSGNSATSTKLATARNFKVNLASTGAASFNGTADATPGVTGTLPIANGGTGATTAAAARSNLGITCANIGAASASHTHGYVPLTGGTITGQISKQNISTSWVSGRNIAPFRTIAASSPGDSQYVPVLSAKTYQGSWDIGPYTSNILHFSYITDVNFNAGNNTQTADIQFQTNGTVVAKNFSGAFNGINMRKDSNGNIVFS